MFQNSRRTLFALDTPSMRWNCSPRRRKKSDNARRGCPARRCPFLLTIAAGTVILASCIRIEPSPFDLSQQSEALAASLAINRLGGLATPAFSPSAGHYTTPQSISILPVTPGASIYYTTDGSTPTSASTLYTAPFHIWKIAGKTIKAVEVRPGQADSGVLSGVFSYATLKTGQTLCLDNAGTVIACSGTGQDGETQLGVARSFTGPTAHAVYSSDYTTTDNTTGLVWKTCTQGRSGAACAAGTSQALSWANASADPTWGCSALNAANAGNGYAGIATWRVPTRMELETLVNHDTTAAPRAFNTAFPATEISGVAYWTSTPYAPNSGTRAWTVEFFNGSSFQALKSDTDHVRCVSGSINNPAYNYTDNGDGTVQDNATGLIWQKCSRGQNNDSTCSGAATGAIWSLQLTYCNGLTLAGRSWRMPNIEELKTLVDTTSTAASKINPAFPSTPTVTFHSSTTFDTDGGTMSYQISPNDGSVFPIGKTNAFNVRCVSGP